MKDLKIKGVIIPNDDKWIYDLFEIDATCPSDVENALNQANGEDVRVIVSSGGGDVQAGNDIRFLLKDYKGNLKIHNTSIAASAAAVICSVEGRECTAEPTAMFMWHNVASYAQGDYNAMDKASSALKAANKSLVQGLVNKTGKSEEECLEIMNKETWYSAKDALEIGLIDGIADMGNESSTRLVANFNSGMLPLALVNKMKSEKQQEKLNDKLKLENQLKFLKLKGEIS